MPFFLVRDDISRIKADAIVNSTHSHPEVGCGVDACIHAKAGPALLEARKQLGQIPAGQGAVTPGYDLQAKFVIHTVVPTWVDGCGEEIGLLRSCYESALQLAVKNRCRSVAFPLLGAGNRGFPRETALQTAKEAIGAFLQQQEMQVYLVVFDRESFRLSEKLRRDIRVYIDDNYVQEHSFASYGLPGNSCREELADKMSARRNALRRMEEQAPAPVKESALPAPKRKPSLPELLRKTDAGFSQKLLELMDETGEKDSAIYTRANVSRQHFSKIRNNPHYKPTKATAIAFAIALRLDLEQTRDLIGRAGFALTNSSKSDVIIMYFIREGNYNIMDINEALFEYDQSLLGA